MRILFVNRSFNNVVGGVENMMANIMNDMTIRGHNISLLTYDPLNAESFYKLNEQINWYKIDIGKSNQKADFLTKLERALCIRKRIKFINPDVIIAFQDGPFRAIRIYSLLQGIPVIAAERNSPSRFNFIKAGKKQNLIYQFFRLAAAITVQFESYRVKYPRYLRHKIVSISNPVKKFNNISRPAKQLQNRFTLLSVGRLEYQKNYMTLLNSFHSLARDFPQWDLKIIGDGQDKQKLQDKIVEYHLEDRVELIGEIKNVCSYYTDSHLFCLPSLWEGFPNALAEAMAHGLPCVGFAKCDGVSDLISNGKTGLLADGHNNEHSLANSLKHLMLNPSLRIKMGKCGISSIAEYDEKAIFDQWEALFQNQLKNKST